MPVPCRYRRTAFLVSSVCWLLFTPDVQAQTPPSAPPTARAVKVAEGPVIDGRVTDDPAWISVAPLVDFWQTAPDAGAAVSERTEVRILYTDDTLYFGVVLWDRDPAGLTVSDARRDSPLDDTDSFRILLDTYRDRQNGFVFATNPAALEYDGQVTAEGNNSPFGGGAGGGGGGGRQLSGSGGGFNLNWDGAWEVRTVTFEMGWSAEFAIPFRTLRYEPGSGREWGVNFERTIRRRKETAYWAPLPIQFDLMRVSLAGGLTGLDLPAQRNLKLVPYALGEARERAQSGPETKFFGDIGLDAKYSVTPALTLDATINTDFAQVEVDEQQINLDRFNLFFPEKRPFFLENAGLFSVGTPGEVEVFFSRRIGIADDGQEIPIYGGARLSGRAGPVNVGLLNMQTSDGPDGQPPDNFTVARVRKDFTNRSNLGAIVVGRVSTGDLATDNDKNAAFAVDGRWGIGETGLVTGYLARSATPGVSENQHAYQIQARNDTQPLTLSLTYLETGENFNPEVGFLSRTGGFRKVEGLVFTRLRPQSWTKFQEIRPHTNYRSYWDHTGFWETGYWHIDSSFELKNAWEFSTGVNLTHEGVVTPFEIYPGTFVPPGNYDHTEAQVMIQTNEGAPVSGRVQVNAGGFFGGDRLRLTPGLQVRVGDRFNTEITWDRNDVDLPWGQFVTNLGRTRVSYSFSPRVFVQGLVQYNDRANVWSSNFRFGWLQQANTGLFVVYTDSQQLDDRGLGTEVADRSLIIKFSQMFDALN
ncbi:MAG TPA: DUF5916 domain-containing protein [Vicinamibacterales bacterium]|nr:DUF5916 domain-containing protein [Vicinamibacterales bacterium]